MISDWITPSNVDQWYILRRLIRRSIRSAYKLWVEENFMEEIAKVIILKYENIYDNVKNNSKKILCEIHKEEEKFRKTLTQWLKEFDKLMKGFKIAFERSGKKITTISGPKSFKLYDTYGFPIEMTEELAKENDFTVDKEGFNKAFEQHQEKSRQWSEKKFKWWMSDNSETVTAMHTATHLLHKALKIVLWDHVEQKGSNITSERLRFDFTHWEKMTDEEKKKVEEIVHEQIQKDLKVLCEEMTVEEAKSQWAIGLFGNKYGEKVKVYSIWNFSKEICWGPHIESLSSIWVFKIKKEQSSSSGVRRIKAVITWI